MILFENFKNIEDICDEYDIKNYTINNDGSIDVNGNVDLWHKNLIKLPLKFNKVSGYFNCCNNDLTLLEGCPKEVGGGFYCAYNLLTSLEGCPKEVGSSFDCKNNLLTSLEGGPEEVGGNYWCEYNKIIKPEGFPKEVGMIFFCDGNPIHKIYSLFPNYKSFMMSLDHEYFRGGNKIDKIRFKFATEEAGIKLPEKLINYNYS